MADQGEIPVNPTEPTAIAAVASTESETQPEVSGKRHREDGECEEPGSKRRAKAQDVLFRIVVPSRQIGKVIGKEGHRIQKIREETKATIKIADAIAVSSLFLICLIVFNLGFAICENSQHFQKILNLNSNNVISDAENNLLNSDMKSEWLL